MSTPPTRKSTREQHWGKEESECSFIHTGLEKTKKCSWGHITVSAELAKGCLQRSAAARYRAACPGQGFTQLCSCSSTPRGAQKGPALFVPAGSAGVGRVPYAPRTKEAHFPGDAATRLTESKQKQVLNRVSDESLTTSIWKFSLTSSVLLRGL